MSIGCLFATTLICAALGSLYCVGRYVNEMLRLCSLICALSVNHPQKFPRPIGTVLELRSHANLPCLGIWPLVLVLSNVLFSCYPI